MPWYDKYFFQVYWGVIASIVILSAAQATHTLRKSNHKNKVQTQYRDTIK